MSNFFTFLSRRTLFKSIFLGIVGSSNWNESLAAAPVTIVQQGSPKSSSATFKVTSTTALKFYVEYGVNKISYGGKSELFTLAKGASKFVELKNLPASTKIYFRLRYLPSSGKSYLSLSQESFVTSKPVNESIFAVQADPHMDENSSEDVYKGTLGQIVKAAPAFLMDLGDIFMVDKLADKSEANIRARYRLMKNYYSLLGDVPLKITLGNHDGELGYSNFNTKSYRKEYFPEQTGEFAYYSFSGPNQLHIVLDPFTYTTTNPKADGWQWTLGKTQYDWLKKTLESSTAIHKFIYIHHLLVGNAQSRGGVEIAKLNEWGGNNSDGSYGFDANRPGWGKPIHQLLKENKVAIVFKGHDHLYVKQELDGIIYQTVPQPSHAGDKVNSSIEYGYLSGKIVGGSGFMKVRTSDTEVQVDFVKFDGTIGDSYVRSI
jgi:hypothetical protein